MPLLRIHNTTWPARADKKAHSRMNIPNILNRLLGNVGIDAALLCGQYESKTDNVCTTKLMLEHTESIARIACEDVRVVVGLYTIVATYDPDGIVVVALPTGHPIAKSMRRLVRRCLANSEKRAAQPRTLTGSSRDFDYSTGKSGSPTTKPVVEEMVDKGLVEKTAPTANVPKPTQMETASPTSVGGVRSW